MKSDLIFLALIACAAAIGVVLQTLRRRSDERRRELERRAGGIIGERK